MSIAVAGSKGVSLIFEEIGSHKKRDKMTMRIDNRQLSLFGVMKNVIGIGESDALRSCDEVGSHNISKTGGSRLKLDILRSDNSDNTSICSIMLVRVFLGVID